MAFIFATVSYIVSPFFVEDVPTSRFTTSAPNLFAAISNELLVLVEFSKNKVTIILPFKISQGLNSKKPLASLKISKISSFVKSEVRIKCCIFFLLF